MEAHLSSCPSCRASADAHRRDNGAVQDDPPTVENTTAADATMTVNFDPGPGPDLKYLIDGYEILHEIHRGGQGVVYKAVQLATKRTVALKVLLHGAHASAAQQHRFEREIDLVASIQHPNIITVYDSGMTQGRYYFAMEYIHGSSLSAYLAGTKLGTVAVLRLFQKICSAVNSAHQRGVIHRDLKPGNICVDADGEPHVLDFGLAKTAGSDLEGGVPVTVTGEFMGTLAYASPEHASGDPKLIDIRADVYSLGVILYEMLTGTYPYPVTGPVGEVLKNIAETEPKRPSAVLPEIGNEVETIVLKALAKEKSRRYQTAEGLGNDIRRYLAGHPISAKMDSTWYILRKSLRRYRYVAGMAAALFVILAGSTIGLSVMYQNQKRARQEATAARAEAQARATELEIVTDFQQSMLSDIDAEAMGQALYADLQTRVRAALEVGGLSTGEIDAVTARFAENLLQANATDVAMELVDTQVLERAVQAIESDFADQPVIRAALQQTVADTYFRIGRYPPALPLQEAALQTRRDELGNDHASTLASMNAMGCLFEAMGRYDEALPYYTEALAGRRRILGDDHPETLDAVNNLGLLLHRVDRLAEAQEYCAEALEGRRRTLGNEHEDTLVAVTNMGALHRSLGQYEEALVYYSEALDGNRRLLGDDHPETLIALNNLASLLQAMDRLDEALAHQREALDSWRRVNGNDHPDTIVSVNNMGSLLMAMGKDEEALEYFREALAGWRRALGDDHPSTVIAISYLGVLLRKMGRLEEAEPYFREALESNRRVLGEDHQNTIVSVHNMGKLLRDLGELEEAEACGARAVEWARSTLPDGHPTLAAFLVGHGMTLAEMERYEEAEGALLEGHGIIETVVGSEHRRTAQVVGVIIGFYEDRATVEPDGRYAAEAQVWRDRLADADGEAGSR